YQLNILASVFTALGAVVFGFAAYEFTKSSSNIKRSWIIPFSSMIYGLMPLTMAQSYFFEVYSLHLLIFNLIAFSFLKAENTSNQKYLVLGIFLILLSFANHLTSIVYIPALIILAIMLRNEIEMPKLIKLSIALAILCAAWYLTLILRSASNPPLD